MWIRLCLIALLACGLQPAWAQTIQVTPQVRAELQWHAPQGLDQGQAAWLGLNLKHQKDWHTYWKNPGDSGLPTAFEWRLPAGVSVGETLWPVPKKLPLGELVNYGFEGEATLVIPLRFEPGFKPPQGPLSVGMTAHWLVCRNECIPQSAEFRMELPWRSGNQLSASIEATLQAQPRTYPGEVQARVVDGQLLITASNTPPQMQGQKLGLFPEQNEVIASPAEQHPRAERRPEHRAEPDLAEPEVVDERTRHRGEDDRRAQDPEHHASRPAIRRRNHGHDGILPREREPEIGRAHV